VYYFQKYFKVKVPSWLLEGDVGCSIVFNTCFDPRLDDKLLTGFLAVKQHMNNIDTITTGASSLLGGDGAKEKQRYENAYKLCIQKIRRNIEDYANQPKPKSWAFDVEGDYSQWDEDFFAIGNWTSSFFTGMALLAWQETEEEHFLKQTLRLAPIYQEKACVRFLDMHHDAGFLYTLYSIALYKLTQDKAHRGVALAAANALYQRFNPVGNFIRAWGRLDQPEEDICEGKVKTDNMAIIDCMMNLPLLFWASLETGDHKYHSAAVCQAETSLKNFVRSDDSVCHAIRFDLKSGMPIGEDNYCGRDVHTYWARGTTWAIYGFALAYRYTGDKRYLESSRRLAKKFIANLDEEVVPVWDFRLPDGEPRLRDSSAAAVAVCGFQELLKHGEDSLISNAKAVLLGRLCSDDYLDANPLRRGILRNGQVGRAKNAYTSWGDYYLMEALAVELRRTETFW
jgi:unsaturated chondroitin disaccharide hydrolase